MAGAALRAPPLPLIEPQLFESEPADRAVLARGIPPVHFQEQSVVPLALVPQLPSQFAECGVLDRAGTSPTHQTLHIQVFNGDDTKFPDQTSRQSMKRVQACLPHPRMSAGDPHTLLLTPVAPLLSPCETALLLAQVPQAPLIVPGVGDLLSCGESREVCQAEIYTYQLARAWKQGAGNFRTEAHVVRPACIPREAHYDWALDLGKPFSELQNSELGQPQNSRTPDGAHPLKSKALATALGLETGITRTLGKE